MVVNHRTVDVVTDNSFIKIGKVMFMAVSPATQQKERTPVAKMAAKTFVEIFSYDISISPLMTIIDYGSVVRF